MDTPQQKQVLLVDNSPIILSLLKHFFIKEGFSVKTAENGLEALEILETYRPEYIFTDLIMPKISGDIFCRILRSRPEFDDVILVVLSAVAAEETIDFFAMGADGCIAKGPAKSMRRHIRQTLAGCTRNSANKGKGEILGLEDVYKREITTELLSTKRHFEVTLEYMEDGFIEITGSGRIIYANSQAAAYFLKSKERLISSLLFDHFENGDQAKIQQNIKKISQDPITLGEGDKIELHGRRILIKIFSVVDGDQKTLILLLRDISKRKALEAQIREHLEFLENTISERTKEYLKINNILQDEIDKRENKNQELKDTVKQFESVIDAFPDLISVHDENMNILRVNKAFAQMFKMPKAKLLHRPWLEIINNRASPSGEWPHITAANEFEAVTGTVRDIVPGENMQITCTPLRHESGLIIGFVQVARKTTDSDCQHGN